ncbi:MAG: alpha-L-fucosidase [Bacteroidaceae bacterium]|nr:alpha-L-fucosidase [Bacteroidaceae bacterium]
MKHFLAVALLACALITSCKKPIEPYGPLPTDEQLALQDMEMYAFLHYSLNTYTDQEWGFGNEDPALFNPSNLDTRQWVRTCKNAGMKGIIFTAKHHCGFCMWPSEYTDYSVKSAPWKDGKGDVVRELAEACREEGLRFAVYLSPWDRNHAEYGDSAYVTYFRNQLRELLTNYGDIYEVWFDGANGGSGWYGGANETRQIDRLTYYDWGPTYDMIRQLQPHCIIWNDGADRRGDLRWVGTEAGNIGHRNWSLMSSSKDPEWADLHYGMEEGDVWCPGETNTSIRPGWFYHTSEDAHVKSLSKLMDTYYKSVERNSTLLLNFPIMPNGLISPIDSVRGAAFSKMVNEVFAVDLARNIKPKTIGDSIFTLDFGKPVTFNRFMVSEDIKSGQRVKRFSLEALVDGEWQPLQDELADWGDGLETIGRKRIICFPEVTATQLRMTVVETKAQPVISRMGVFLAPELTADIPDAGEKKSSAYNIFYPGMTVNGVRSMFIDLGQTKRVSGFHFLPDQNHREGMPLEYVVLGSSDDGKTWIELSKGEFSNIENNPIWQKVTFDAQDVKLLRLDCPRITSGNNILYEDIEVIVVKKDKK